MGLTNQLKPILPWLCVVVLVAGTLLQRSRSKAAEEELAAVSLGASGWQMFRRVTLPNIKWGVLYGVILCNARAMGEFGAVYVVSGRITGQTDTLPLRVEKLFQESNNAGSFAVASVLTLLALVTLLFQKWVGAWGDADGSPDTSGTGAARLSCFNSATPLQARVGLRKLG